MAELYTPFSEFAARRALPLVTAFSRVTWDLEVTGRDHVPAGPIVFAGNHQSHVDPVLLSTAVQMNVRYLAVDELFNRSVWFDRLILFWGSIPISRTRPPLGALRTAIAHLESGGPVGVFPEGRRTTYWGEEPPKRGAAWLALRTGAPLIPVAIAGAERTLSHTESRFRRTPVRIWIEPPLDPGRYLDRVDPLDAMMSDWRTAMDSRLGAWVSMGDGVVVPDDEPAKPS